MKALTLMQPWASLILAGFKTIETRSWKPRPPFCPPFEMAIHCSKRLPPADQIPVLPGILGDVESLPRGAVIATCTVLNIDPTADLRNKCSQMNLDFGNFADGRWGWVLGNVRALDPPVPCSGRLYLWDWTPAATGHIPLGA